MRRLRYSFLLAVGLFLLVGCGAAREILYGGRSADKEALMPAPEPSRGGAPMTGMSEGESRAEEPTEAALDAEGRPQIEQRKRIYSGFARLEVGDVGEEKERIARLTAEWGGYVESAAESTVVLRVPAALFDQAFERLLALGEVLARRVETFDVTEQYQDLASRMDIARRTRERLYALLERATDVEERLAILREIRRLTEEIERIEITLELLDRRVALSRITLQLVPRLAEDSAQRAEIPFDWIAALDPLYAAFERLRVRLALELPQDFAVFEREKIFRAESPEGMRVRVGTTANRPRADAEFWQKALIHHLGPLYRSAEAVELGAFRGALFRSKDREPFYYLVAVSPEGKKLHVLEVFFPSSEAFADREASLREAIAAAEVN